MNHSDFTDDLNKLKEKLVNNNVLYLFGYGSLLWKVDFEYTRKMFGFVKNYKRQFWLLSDDHRGTPENMGRVVTLVKTNQETDKVYGLAYEIHTDNMEKTFEYLNFREKCGYSLNEVVFYPNDDSLENQEPINCLCYFANQENSYYSPCLDIKALSFQIYKSAGPSGTNKEYLYNFCNALRGLVESVSKKSDQKNEILQYDKHLFELECFVKEFDRQT